MCLGGGGSPKVSTPEPPPLPPPLPAPAPPPVQKIAPVQIQKPDAPDIRIGAAKKPSRSGRDRGSSLSIGNSSSSNNNQGLNL